MRHFEDCSETIGKKIWNYNRFGETVRDQRPTRLPSQLKNQ